MTRTPTVTDTLIRSSYGDPLRTKKGLNPYQRFPERSTWTESEVYMGADGVEWQRRRDCARWVDVTTKGEWYEVRDLGIEWRRTVRPNPIVRGVASKTPAPDAKWTEWTPWRTKGTSADAVRRELAENFYGHGIEVRSAD